MVSESSEYGCVYFSLHFSDHSAAVALHGPFYSNTKMCLHMAASGIIFAVYCYAYSYCSFIVDYSSCKLFGYVFSQHVIHFYRDVNELETRCLCHLAPCAPHMPTDLEAFT
jgi:hypothetical protein